MRYHKIADETIRRLPIYLRGLLSLSEQNQANISSQNMADLLGVNPWQIRKDFSYFDTNPKKIGRKVKNITIEDVSINKSKPFLGTAAEYMGLCAPKKSRQQRIKIRPCCRDPSDVRFRRAFSRD